MTLRPKCAWTFAAGDIEAAKAMLTNPGMGVAQISRRLDAEFFVIRDSRILQHAQIFCGWARRRGFAKHGHTLDAQPEQLEPHAPAPIRKVSAAHEPVGAELLKCPTA